MKLTVEIPEEFETDFRKRGAFGEQNGFVEFFKRAKCNLEDDLKAGRGVCGRYEIETCEMFAEAFANAQETV